MMERTRILFILTCVFMCVAVQVKGQSSELIKEKQISSQTVYEYFVEEGMDEPLIESVRHFDENGEVLELKELNKKGDVKRWEKYSYDENGSLVEEVFLSAKGKVERTERTIYEDGIKKEKQYFNNREVLYKRKVYEYEYRK